MNSWEEAFGGRNLRGAGFRRKEKITAE